MTKQLTFDLLEQIGQGLFGKAWQAQLADALNVDRRNIQNWKKQGVAKWVAEELQNIAEVRTLEMAHARQLLSKITGNQNMKNIKFVKSIISDFNTAKEAGELSIQLADLNQRIARFKNNFNPQLDDFAFTLHFEISQPQKELIQKLQDEGKQHLITDNPDNVALQDEMKYEYRLKFRISIKALVDAWSGELDDDDNEIWTVDMRHIGTAKLDDEAKTLVRAQSPPTYMPKLKEAIAYLNQWLNREFGQSDDDFE